MISISEIRVGRNTAIRDAMQCIQNNNYGIALVLDDDLHLLATITDGDIRAAILRGSHLDDPVEVIRRFKQQSSSYTTPITAPADADAGALLGLMKTFTIRHVPLINPAGQVVDMAMFEHIADRSSKWPELVIRAIHHVLPADKQFFPLHEPEFSGNEWKYVKECLDSGWVSSAGTYVDVFEERLKEYTGVRGAAVVVNGTSALHTCLILCGVVKDDEVIVPALTFVATANAVAYCGAVPHLADCEERTLGLDAVRLAEYLHEISETREECCFNRKTGRRIKAVVAVHMFGHPVDLDALAEVCQRFHLKLVEDAAQALGSFYKGRHAGNWGMVSALSFNGNKIITSGGGGAILTNDPNLAKEAKHLTTTARIPHPWAYAHDRIGYNYRMPNLNAALGCAQLERLPDFLASKRALAVRYNAAFQNVEGVRFFHEPEFARSNYWLNTILLTSSFRHRRNELVEAGIRMGILMRPAWTLMHRLPMFTDCPRMPLTMSENIEERLINIPSGAALGSD